MLCASCGGRLTRDRMPEVSNSSSVRLARIVDRLLARCIPMLITDLACHAQLWESVILRLARVARTQAVEVHRGALWPDFD